MLVSSCPLAFGGALRDLQRGVLLDTYTYANLTRPEEQAGTDRD